MLNEASFQAIRAAFDLFLGRRDAIRSFDFSVDGFWRSFGALVFILPLFAVSVAVEHRLRLADPAADAIPDSLFLAARGLDLVVDWVALPAILAALARPLGIARSYAAYIVVRNWASVVTTAPHAALSLLAGVGLMPLELAAFASLIVLGVMLYYHYRIVGLTLGGPIPFRIAIVAFDFALSLVLAQGIDRLFGV